MSLKITTSRWRTRKKKKSRIWKVVTLSTMNVDKITRIMYLCNEFLALLDSHSFIYLLSSYRTKKNEKIQALVFAKEPFAFLIFIYFLFFLITNNLYIIIIIIIIFILQLFLQICTFVFQLDEIIFVCHYGGLYFK